MTTWRLPWIPLIIAAVLAITGLAACSSGTPATNTPAPIAAVVQPGPASSLMREDSQGAVIFKITPRNLAAPGTTLDFDVVLDTHSVDLAWDLAAQAKLTTDTGLEVSGQSWPVGAGHHVEGLLTFPANTADGKLLVDGATTLTLTIRETDVPERVFVWQLTP